jgi:hypothetical protein
MGAGGPAALREVACEKKRKKKKFSSSFSRTLAERRGAA